MNTIKRFGVIIIACAGSAWAGTAGAGTATADFDVTLTIQPDCTIAANPLDFGTTGVLDANLDAQTTITVTCTNTTAYQVGLNAGQGSAATEANRLMTGATSTATVAYQLYQDSARQITWGNTVGSSTYSNTGTGTAQTISVYGRVAPQSTPAPDAYKDTVTATISF